MEANLRIAFSLLFLILTITQPLLSETNTDILQIRFHGDAMRSYVDDRMTIGPNGLVELITHSPFQMTSEPNAIGTFSTPAEPALLTKVRNEATNLFANRNSKPLTMHDSVVGELSVVGSEAKKGFVWNFESVPKAKAFESLYYDLKAKILTHPKAAISLTCKRLAANLVCSYTNFGTDLVNTVDPLGVAESIFCLSPSGKRGVLNPGEEDDPRKMTPKRVVLKANEKFDFEINDRGYCKTQVIVKTSDLMINPNYKNSLLGELISNKLMK